MKLEKNVGARDAQIRTVAGAVIIVVALFLVDNPWVQLVLALVAAVLAATGYLHSCYLYKLLGKNTAQDAPATSAQEPAETKVSTEKQEPASVEEVSAETESEKVS